MAYAPFSIINTIKQTRLHFRLRKHPNLNELNPFTKWKNLVNQQKSSQSATKIPLVIQISSEFLCVYNVLKARQWMSIIENLPQLQVIETSWSVEDGVDSIVDVMTSRSKTNLKKIILLGMTAYKYKVLRDMINGRQCQMEGNIHRFGTTFIQRENKFRKLMKRV